MADYSSEEIQAAVEQVVKSSIRRPYGFLGNRDGQATFSDLTQAAAGVFVLKPNAPFYIVFLGAQRLKDQLQVEQLILQSLIEAIENTNRYVTKIDNLAPLNNARAALDALNAASGTRSHTFQSIESVPAFQRYSSNIQRFLNESSKNAVVKNKIASTPQESRAAIPGLISSLKEQHGAVLFRSLHLAGSIDDYDALQIPASVTSSVIANARDVLESQIASLNALTPEKRLSKIRDVTLSILAGKAAIQGLGSLRSTTEFALIDGVGVVFADASHPATPASLTAAFGPYSIWAGKNTLDFVVDSAFTFSVPVPGSFLARVDSFLAEPYFISGGNNDELHFSSESPSGSVPVSLILTSGVRTAAQVASEINAAMPVDFPFIAEAVFQTIRFIGIVNIDASGGPSSVVFTLTSGSWSDLGILVGNLVKVTDVTSANLDSEFSVSTIAGSSITCLQTSGPTPVTESLIQVELGIGRTIRFRIADGLEQQAIAQRIGITFPNSSDNTALIGNPNAPSTVPQALGFSVGAHAESRATTAAQVVQALPLLAPTASSGTPRLDASVELVASIWSGNGRSDPNNLNKLIAYKLWARGDVGSGTSGVVFTVSGAVDAGVIVGDTIVIRETPVSADTNVQGLVTSVDSTSITADMAQAITGGTGLQLEVGPTITLSSEYLDAQVIDGTSQSAAYSMAARGQGSVPFEFTMDRQVPSNRGAGGQPVFFSLDLGYSRVIFKSTVTDLTTKVRVTNTSSTSAADQFFTSLPVEAVGTTKYFQIPKDPKTLQIGDILELNETTYNTVSRSFGITGLELSSLLIQVDPELNTDLASISMSAASGPPFARIRLAKKNNFVLLEERLLDWLALAVNQADWFIKLNSLLNPLLASSNPSSADVSTAKLYVQELLSVLTRSGAIATSSNPDGSLESILASYKVAPIEEVNTLLDTYQERGALRGIDILLQGRFSDFFGLTAEAMSYDGAAREALKDVQRLDLPVRKIGRTSDLSTTRTVAQWEDSDFEFDQSDTESAPDVEIPGEFVEISPPGR